MFDSSLEKSYGCKTVGRYMLYVICFCIYFITVVYCHFYQTRFPYIMLDYSRMPLVSKHGWVITIYIRV